MFDDLVVADALTRTAFLTSVLVGLVNGVRPPDLKKVRDLQSWIGLALLVGGVLL